MFFSCYASGSDANYVANSSVRFSCFGLFRVHWYKIVKKQKMVDGGRLRRETGRTTAALQCRVYSYALQLQVKKVTTWSLEKAHLKRYQEAMLRKRCEATHGGARVTCMSGKTKRDCMAVSISLLLDSHKSGFFSWEWYLGSNHRIVYVVSVRCCKLIRSCC